jgi:phospholipid/cholesterol/gamma-HCH transport system substrate-binding protein
VPGKLAKLDGVTRILSVVIVVAVVVGLVFVALPDQKKRYLTASFPRTVSLYEGSDVRILGVPVGKVETVRPEGTDVRVRMWYDAKYDVPADAEAVIISPAIVGDRFVQLTPVFEKGEERLRDHAVLTTRSTSTPLELDEIYQSIDSLSVALGPQGANSGGALTRVLDSTAKNFQGEGAQFHQTITDVSRLTGTLDDNKEELFGTARELERFVSALATNDKTVRRFNDSLASASDLLDDERQDLAAALRNLGVALQAVKGFVRENRSALSRNIKGLNSVSKVLVHQRAALEQVLRVAPTALANLLHTYNPTTGTLDQRSNINESLNGITADPGKFLCGLITAADKSNAGAACDLLGKALPKPRAGALTAAGTSTGPARQAERVDTTLGGILQAQR